MSIRVGILGYGNLGKGVESAIAQNDDMELKAVFTRRNPENVKVRTAGVKVLQADELSHMQDELDVAAAQPIFRFRLRSTLPCTTW